MSRLRRALGTLLVVGAALTTTTVPASANQQPTYTRALRTSAVHTDLRAPHDTIPTNGDYPVGTWRDADGKLHNSKAYFTFDLSWYRGARLISAKAHVWERDAADCSRPRAVELWRTDVSEQPTYAHAPREIELIPGRTSPECRGYSTWDLAKVFADTLAAGRTKVTVALRLSGARQWDVRDSRRFADLFAEVASNFAPGTPTDLRTHGTACGDTVLRRWDPAMLTATYTDADPYHRGTPRFVVQNVDRPEDRREFTGDSAFGGDIRGRLHPLTDAQTYEWTVQVDDGLDLSPVSAPCRFTTDYTAPLAPVVSSTDYPENTPYPGVGGGHVPGTFTFEPDGATDVVAYTWEIQGAGRGEVAADEQGRATARIEPGNDGWTAELKVRAVDRAGNPGPERAYKFTVANTKPWGEVTPHYAVIGTPREVVLKESPHLPGIVGYTYRDGNRPPVTVVPDADGTARFTVPGDQPGPVLIMVSGVTAAGVRTAEVGVHYYVDPGQVSVAGVEYPEWGVGGDVGVPGTFEFSSTTPQVVAYEYALGSDEWVSVPAVDGRASITYTPTATGFHNLQVRARTSWGFVTDHYSYVFFVAHE
ncbi:hypothetical protein AB0A74_10605 [Saccharothrix sp. NPDC042600]|uniref:hypothetical protein n=1 Tax=Saccharothrix TaxID=2071 RepID=UPI0033E3E3D4